MTYLHTILTRSNNEVTKRVLIAQKESPTKGDFFNLVQEDYNKIGEILDIQQIENTSKERHKRYIKSKISISAFRYLKEKQSKHSKVKDIIYQKLEMQNYMKSPLFTNEEVSLLFAIRSMAIDCKINFRNKYNKDDLLCSVCQQEEESQIHILHCKVLNDVLRSNELIVDQVNYQDIYGDDHRKQKVITTIFSKLLSIRKQILENPENTTNPSNPDRLLKSSYDVQNSIVNYSSGI